MAVVHLYNKYKRTSGHFLSLRINMKQAITFFISFVMRVSFCAFCIPIISQFKTTTCDETHLWTFDKKARLYISQKLFPEGNVRSLGKVSRDVSKTIARCEPAR